MEKKRILIIWMGGTIAMVPGEKGLRPAKNVEEILALVPGLKERASLEWRELENLDSTNITPSHWSRLAMEISDAYQNYDGIIITHGTDTMAYTATAISLALGRGIKIPVIFTGSQLPLIEFGTDAKFNLENSMKVILHAIEDKINEVMIVFSHRVLRGNRSIKISEADFVAFGSPAFPDLATITATGSLFLPTALKVDANIALNLQAKFQRGILAVELVPGIEPAVLLNALKSGSCQGLLLKSLGAGNVPSMDEYSILPVIEKAVNLKIPVMVSTKFVGGKTRMDIYEVGQLALDAGAISARDLTDVAAQVKLMWALAQGYYQPTELQKIIDTDFVGEVSII